MNRYNSLEQRLDCQHSCAMDRNRDSYAPPFGGRSIAIDPVYYSGLFGLSAVMRADSSRPGLPSSIEIAISLGDPKHSHSQATTSTGITATRSLMPTTHTYGRPLKQPGYSASYKPGQRTSFNLLSYKPGRHSQHLQVTGDLSHSRSSPYRLDSSACGCDLW